MRRAALGARPELGPWPAGVIGGSRWGGGRTEGRDFALSSRYSLSLPISQPDAGTCKQRFSAPLFGGCGKGGLSGAQRQDPGVGRAEVPHRDLGSDLRQPDPAVGVERKELSSLHFQLALRVLKKGAGLPHPAWEALEPRIGGPGVLRALQTG